MLTIPEKDKEILDKSEKENNTTRFLRNKIGEPIGKKSTRRVFILPSNDYVVKVDDRRFPRQNKRALELWEKYRTTDVGDHLAPITYYGEQFEYIVQKRAKHVGQLKKEEIEIYKEMFENFGLIVNRKKHEFGRMGNGRVVLIDLGEVSES